MSIALAAQNTIAQISDETLKLKAFIGEHKPGTKLSYKFIEHETGITMDAQGKARLRSALNSLKMEATNIRGEGIVLSSPDNANAIVATRFGRIDGAVRRSERTVRRLKDKHYEDMNPAERKKLGFAIGVLGAIRITAEQCKDVHKKQLPSNTTVNIPLPVLNT